LTNHHNEYHHLKFSVSFPVYDNQLNNHLELLANSYAKVGTRFFISKIVYVFLSSSFFGVAVKPTRVPSK